MNLRMAKPSRPEPIAVQNDTHRTGALEVDFPREQQNGQHELAHGHRTATHPIHSQSLCKMISAAKSLISESLRKMINALPKPFRIKNLLQLKHQEGWDIRVKPDNLDKLGRRVRFNRQARPGLEGPAKPRAKRSLDPTGLQIVASHPRGCFRRKA